MDRRDKPKKAKAGAKRPLTRKSPNEPVGNGDVEKRLAEALGQLQTRNRELAEAHEQQTATSEILRAISISPTDVQPVFEAICQSAVRLFGAYSGAIVRSDGDMMHLGAVVSPRAEADQRYQRLFPRRLDREFASGRAILDRAIVHVPDTERETSKRNRSIGRDFGYRRVLVVPMLRDGDAIGALAVTGRETGRYSDQQIALLKMFADQAVIAIENVRLFNETKEALEQQTATAEILRVISQSPTDVQPVLDVIARNAVGLCDGYFSLVGLSDGECVHLRAMHKIPEEWTKVARTVYPLPLSSDIGTAQAIREQRVVHILDVQEDPAVSALGRERARLAGYHTWLGVPMLGPSGGLGVIAVARREKAAFTNQQVALLQTFADQAVIAIENVRLFTELEGRNRDLTATSEILRVIAGSPTDPQPVFDAILKRAATLCEAQLAHLWLYEGGEQFRLGAGYGSRPDHLQWLQQGLHRFGQPFFRESGPWRVGQVLDVRDTEPYRRGEPLWIRTADHEGMRTLLGVPLVKDGRLVGSIAVYRREVQPFTDQQTALVQTFADQAVIAIENVAVVQGAGGTDGRADAVGGTAHRPGRGRARRQFHARSRNRAEHDRSARRPTRRGALGHDLGVRRSGRGIRLAYYAERGGS